LGEHFYRIFPLHTDWVSLTEHLYIESIHLKAEKYIITTEGVEHPIRITRMGFGVTGEEVQQFLADGAPRVRVHVVGPEKECTFAKEKGKDPRLHDIKQKIKSLTLPE
jgi:hypothetical protein